MLFLSDQLCPGMDPSPLSFGQYSYFIPNPEDCTLFYRCDRHMNHLGRIEYKASLYKCPDNHGFDVNSKVCRRIVGMPCCFRGTVNVFSVGPLEMPKNELRCFPTSFRF